MNKKILIALSFLVMTVVSCDIEKFAELNTDPAALSKPNVPFLFTTLVQTMNDQAYDEWFYDNDKYFLTWSQVNVGVQSTWVRIEESFNVNNRDVVMVPRYTGYMNVFVYAREIWDVIDNRMSEDDRAAYQCIRAAVYPLAIYKALKVTDVMGSIPYTEAGLAKFTNPMLLTPKYDTQEDLFNLWDSELKAAFEVLNNPPANQLLLGANDWIWGGTASSWKNWAKFTNTMRLKIAARWYLQNPGKAKAIVEEVWNSGVYMSEMADDYVHFAGRTSDPLSGSTSRWTAYGNKVFIDFLRENRDPRLRWFFEKNSWSSSVVKAFLSVGRPLPDVMKPYIQVSADGTDFTWINGGEPWGRYHGIPCKIGDDLTQDEREYWLGRSQFQLPEIMESNTDFFPYSNRSAAFIAPRSSAGFDRYPDIIIGADGKGQRPPEITTQTNYHYRGRFATAAEALYLLAEFKVLGANISEDANSLFHKAIELSVRSHNQTASDHNTGYYRTVNLDTQYGIITELGLGQGAAAATAEITNLLTKPAYNLTGNQLEDLEKIYVNMIVHYNQTPTEILVTARRGGVPKIGSAIGFEYTQFTRTQGFKVPRRLNIDEPLGENINAENIRKAMADQGFEFSIAPYPDKLHDQRVWYDKPAPDWGQGPIVK